MQEVKLPKCRYGGFNFTILPTENDDINVAVRFADNLSEDKHVPQW